MRESELTHHHRGGQVVVVPLRVNVNLKAVTVEDLVDRRKVVLLSSYE
jgi:hypothetical protein